MSRKQQDGGAGYDVGYGRPPQDKQFKPGTSGNPRGRPKGARNFASIISAALNERVSIVENGRRRKITKLEAAVTQLVNRAATGEARAQQIVFGIAQTIEARAELAPPREFTDADQVVLRDILRRFGKDVTP